MSVLLSLLVYVESHDNRVWKQVKKKKTIRHNWENVNQNKYERQKMLNNEFWKIYVIWTLSDDSGFINSIAHAYQHTFRTH